MNLDDIFDLGRQHTRGGGGEWVYGEGLCVTCGKPATIGSWCTWDHPGFASRERCVFCGRPLTDGVERSTGICHLCRDRR